MIMRASGSSLAMLAASAIAVAGVSGFMLWPAFTASEARALECGRLLTQVARYDAIAIERDRMLGELVQARASASRVLREIPAVADQAHLMRMLAVGASSDMGTQTIVAGDVIPASASGKGGLRAVPVTVEMHASFERVMEVLARAEGDRRLVRPIHIEIQRAAFDPNARGAKQTDGALPLVEARLELDAVFGAAITAAVEEQP